jgi:hypothetical protein
MRSSPILIAATLLLIACGGADEPPAADTTTEKKESSGSSAKADDDVDGRTAIERCSGDFTCSAQGRSVTTTLKRVGTVCTTGGFTLESDGRATSSDANNASWASADPNTFSICIGTACLRCTAKNPRPTTGLCVGEPKSCEAGQAVDGAFCEKQSGCYRYPNDSDNCIGTPTPCGNLKATTTCLSQRGCNWWSP